MVDDYLDQTRWTVGTVDDLQLQVILECECSLFFHFLGMNIIHVDHFNISIILN